MAPRRKKINRKKGVFHGFIGVIAFIAYALPLMFVTGVLDYATKLRDQTMKMMDAVFAPDGEPSAIVMFGTQPALHAFADSDIFLLDFIAEIDSGLLHAHAVIAEPFENR